MVKKAVLMGIREGAIGPESLYGLDDAGFAALLARGGQWAAPALAALGGAFYLPIAELAFDAANPVHDDLCSLNKRLEAEASLAAACGMAESDLVIDIPEPINFDTELRVSGGGKSMGFSDMAGPFGGSNRSDLAASLRKIRIFAKPGAFRPNLAGLGKELLS
jgi:hypothetical protein